MYEYENTRRVAYDLGEGQGQIYFLPVCPTCGRYVKMDDTIKWGEYKGLSNEPNATCGKHGRIKLESEGIY